MGGRWRAARPFPGPSGWVRVHPAEGEATEGVGERSMGEAAARGEEE